MELFIKMGLFHLKNVQVEYLDKCVKVIVRVKWKIHKTVTDQTEPVHVKQAFKGLTAHLVSLSIITGTIINTDIHIHRLSN